MTRIASHRGGTLEYGDSTPQGFVATSRMAVEEVEFDVHPTSDGAIMVHHDATLDRTTDRTGAIAALTEAEVRAATIDYCAGGHPLSLSELVDIFRPGHVDLRCEIKPGENGRAYPGLVPRVIETIRVGGMLERTTFSSFLLESLEALRAATDRPVLWLVSPMLLRLLGLNAITELALSRHVPELGFHIDDADAELMRTVEDKGLDFGCWAAHNAEQIGKAFDLGVKVFTTDRPSLAVAIRSARQSAGPAS